MLTLTVSLTIPYGVVAAEESEIKPVMLIDLIGNSLNVELENAPFGEVIADIANKAGFETAVAGGISRKTLTTRFSDTDLKRAILRLLSLIDQKTYFIHYDAKGEIRKIEVYGVGSEPKRKPTTPRTGKKTMEQPVEGGQPLPPHARPFYVPEDESEEAEAPYIPPKQAPVFIPPLPPGK